MHRIDFQMPVRKYFRKRRLKNFIPDYQSCRTILDVGGAHYTWDIIGRSEGVAIINIELPEDTGGFKDILGARCDMPFSHGSLHLAFFKSATSHVSHEEKPFQFAPAMKQVGKLSSCPTPARPFPI